MEKIIKILHQDCCMINPIIKKRVEKVAEKNNIAVQVEDLRELEQVMMYGTSEFPAVVVNDKVYSYKKHHSDEELLKILNA
ncbi:MULTISPECIES: thioredoxin family protein [Flammeovirga]|uniref:Thioredoxin family protein n=1 Tax=Flammeovirga agarivorans TaxID=2726742 RepID=A0A7X8XUZ1_9BACT|nr:MULTISPECIES: thioredoxin family protein [Flammeovirga]NLR90813.1 thioredoxin family protein [Flammeovirga agarivorans]